MHHITFGGRAVPSPGLLAGLRGWGPQERGRRGEGGGKGKGDKE